MSRAEQLLHGSWQPVAADGRARSRPVAIGDLQSSFEHVARILHNHSLLGSDGQLAPDVFLISVGDHYDYSGASIEAVGREGQKILRWLAAHPPDQVVILAGNHDLSRVQELALQTDASFAEARGLARAAEELRKKENKSAAEEREHTERVERFHAAYPDLATPELADRDYATFTEEQQRFVQALLVAGRIRLAHVGRTREGAEILFTHAGVNRNDIELLGKPREEPHAIADALNAFLDAAVKRVAPAWTRGERAALDLSPLHVSGRGGREGGGLLYHRPVLPMRALDDALAPRIYEASQLPALVQACGHTGHKKSLKDLKGALTPSALGFLRGGLRTLSVTEEGVRYEAGIVPGAERVLHMIDAEINYVAPDAYPILELSAGTARRSSS